MTIPHIIGRKRNEPISHEDKHRGPSTSILRFFTFSRNQSAGYSAVDSDPDDSRRQPFLSPQGSATFCQGCKPQMSSTRVLRTIAVVSLIPGFGLSIATAVVVKYVVCAIGLLPLFFSAGFNGLLLATSSSTSTQSRTPSAHGDDGGESHLRPSAEERGSLELEKRHPFLVFLADVILATSLMIVLVFTWILFGSGRFGWNYYGSRTSGSSAMLATYTTIPLLVNFFIHAWLAVREFVAGTGLGGVFTRVRYQGIPADCPGCGVNIRPATPPTPPWFDSVTVPSVSFRQVTASVPAVKVPAILGQAKSAARDWKAPAWMKGASNPESESLIANQEGGEASQLGYRDDYDEDATNVRPSVDLPSVEEQGASTVEEVVVSKKDKKGKGTDEEQPSW